MNQQEKIDKALCELNQEILDLRNSCEYQMGVKISKFLYAIKHFQIKSLFIGMEHKMIARKLSKGHKANKDFLTFDNSIITSTRIAIYTCITGNYDRLIEPIYVPEDVDFFIVTDMEISPKSIWRKIDINLIEIVRDFDDTRKARYVKTHPHIFFDEYE